MYDYIKDFLFTLIEVTLSESKVTFFIDEISKTGYDEYSFKIRHFYKSSRVSKQPNFF